MGYRCQGDLPFASARTPRPALPQSVPEAGSQQRAVWGQERPVGAQQTAEGQPLPFLASLLYSGPTGLTHTHMGEAMSFTPFTNQMLLSQTPRMTFNQISWLLVTQPSKSNPITHH